MEHVELTSGVRVERTGWGRVSYDEVRGHVAIWHPQPASILQEQRVDPGQGPECPAKCRLQQHVQRQLALRLHRVFQQAQDFHWPESGRSPLGTRSSFVPYFRVSLPQHGTQEIPGGGSRVPKHKQGRVLAPSQERYCRPWNGAGLVATRGPWNCQVYEKQILCQDV